MTDLRFKIPKRAGLKTFVITGTQEPSTNPPVSQCMFFEGNALFMMECII
jgi:hypothetical protein